MDNHIPVESLQSHCIHTQFHWSSGPPVCFLLLGTRVQTSGGYLCETRILLLALYRYIPIKTCRNVVRLSFNTVTNPVQSISSEPIMLCQDCNVIFYVSSLDMTHINQMYTVDEWQYINNCCVIKKTWKKNKWFSLLKTVPLKPMTLKLKAEGVDKASLPPGIYVLKCGHIKVYAITFC